MTDETKWTIVATVAVGLVGAAASVWAGLRSSRAKRVGITVVVSQAIAMPPAANDPIDFYSISVRNSGDIPVTFPVLCAHLRIKGWNKGFVFVPRIDILDSFLNSPYGPFSDVRFAHTLVPGRSFSIMVSRRGFDALMSEKGKTGQVKIEAAVTDDIHRTFVSKPIKSTIAKPE